MFAFRHELRLDGCWLVHEGNLQGLVLGGGSREALKTIAWKGSSNRSLILWHFHSVRAHSHIPVISAGMKRLTLRTKVSMLHCDPPLWCVRCYAGPKNFVIRSFDNMLPARVVRKTERRMAVLNHVPP